MKPAAVVLGEAKAFEAEETCIEAAQTMKQFENTDSFKLILYDRKSEAMADFKPKK